MNSSVVLPPPPLWDIERVVVLLHALGHICHDPYAHIEALL